MAALARRAGRWWCFGDRRKWDVWATNSASEKVSNVLLRHLLCFSSGSQSHLPPGDPPPPSSLQKQHWRFLMCKSSNPSQGLKSSRLPKAGLTRATCSGFATLEIPCQITQQLYLAYSWWWLEFPGFLFPLSILLLKQSISDFLSPCHLFCDKNRSQYWSWYHSRQFFITP